MKRLFYFSGKKLVIYDWHKNEFISREEFLPYEDNDKLKLQLEKHKGVAVRILVDVIEEEFSQETLPFVRGADRQALFARTKKKKYRSKKFSYIELQGREKEGRKDLKVLLSALLNQESLEYWLEIIEDAHVPIEGIYSLPIIGELLTPYISANKGNSLVISQQGSETLRQSFYVDGQLLQSRLSTTNNEQDMDYIHLLEAEIIKTMRFLESVRARKKNDELNVFILTSQFTEEILKDHIKYEDNVNYSILSNKNLTSKVGIKGEPPSNFSDVLFAHLLFKKSYYKNQYATVKERSRYFHLIIKKGLNWASFVLLIGVAFFVISGIFTWLEKDNLIDLANIDLVDYHQKINKKQKEIVTYDYRATTTKEIVELYDKLKNKTYSEPKKLFNILSAALTKNPKIVPREIIWQITENSQIPIQNNVENVNIEKLDFNKPDLLILKLTGKVITFEDNYRLAIQYHRKFLDDLKKIPGVISVKDIQAPFNLNSTSTIVGDSGTEAQVVRKSNAVFKLQLEMSAR